MQELTDVLTKFSQQLLHNQQSNKTRLVRLLLLDIDSQNFEHILSKYQPLNYLRLRQAIRQYYATFLGEKALIKISDKAYFKDEFLFTFELIVDLAFQIKKTAYIQVMMEMGEEERGLLMPFVEHIMQRHFIIRLTNSARKNSEENGNLQEEYELLREMYEQLEKKNLELAQSYSNLRESKDKLSEEIIYLKQERQYLLSQIGGNEYNTFEQVVEKYKRDLNEYQKEIYLLQKAGEEKSSQLKAKENEMHELEEGFKLNHYQEKARLYDKLTLKASELEAEVKMLRDKEVQNASQIQKLKDSLAKKCKEVEDQAIIIQSRQNFQQKYKAIKQLHSHFKSKFPKDIKQ